MNIPKKMSAGGKDYPTTWSEFLDWFHSEDACRLYLEGLRWSEGFTCPKCGVVDAVTRSSRSRLVCRSCKHQTTVTTNTIFDKTRTELRVWFAAIWYITNQKHGVSALGLQRVLGLGSYETAWTMLHRLRRAMVRPDRELLHGEVEVDETYLALTDRKFPLSSEGRKSNTTQIMVAIAVEMLQPKGFGRIRIRRIDKGNYENLIPFMTESIVSGSIIHSDGSAAYSLNEVCILGQTFLPINRCQASIVLQLCSSGGYWERITVQFNQSSWITIWMNSYFASIVAHRNLADCSFTDYFNKLS